MSRDLRKYTRQTHMRLIIGGILLIFILGDGLIYLIYGPSAAVTGLICIAVGLAPAAIIIVILWIMEIVVKRTNGE
ncbi:MAG TPA: hypothetical protein VMT46_13540 [Anaerolineaceae bacterium]|nr:hypothetical protein [Anaerolineaceae bacterium]